MTSAYSITFENDTVAQVAELSSAEQVESALQTLAMPTPKATLVVIGGASGLTDEYLDCLRNLFIEVVCPFAEAHQLAVVDGGTDSGVMRLMGKARAETQSTFPLLGIVVKEKTFLPNEVSTAQDASALEPHHTHFVLVPGTAWGDESPWIAQVADSVAGEMPSATLLINGGEIALHKDVPNSLGSQRPVLVIAGSGRAADQLAAALKGSNSDDAINAMISTGMIQAVALTEGTERLKQALDQAFRESIRE
ncbi:MAG TPA: hypothetical protein V6D29_18975 [Leptolyngbyaceae cyanobacterium]